MGLCIHYLYICVHGTIFYRIKGGEMIVLLEIFLFILALYLLVKFANAFLFKESRNRNIIKNSPITREQWNEAYSHLPFLRGLSAEDKQSLEELCILYIHYTKL